MSEKIVQLNEEVIKGQIKELVRGSVEETLNELLEAEAEKLTHATRYERNEQRQGYRSGHYSRNLTTTSGDVTLKVPKLKGIPFETAIIERYRRRESSVEEALIEMYLAGVSVRRVEDSASVMSSYYTKTNYTCSFLFSEAEITAITIKLTASPIILDGTQWNNSVLGTMKNSQNNPTITAHIELTTAAFAVVVLLLIPIVNGANTAIL